MARKRPPAAAAGVQGRSQSTVIQGLPVQASPPASAVQSIKKVEGAGGLKASTVGTTLYLLPEESWRLKQLAVNLRTTVHELMLCGLDRIFAEHDQPPIRRYVSTTPRRVKNR
jgi:hypothetical protein